jgi:hypothetical protein
MCMKCFQENGQPSEELFAATPEDSGLYRLTCTAGHESVTCLQQMKFEVLFDIGAYAIVDGYHREAVSSFTSALERIYEFYIEVQAAAHKVSVETYEATWNQVSKQSERQLGAFLFVRALCTKSAPLVPRYSDVEFRNAVIHKGKIPSRQEALDYGQRVLDLILHLLKELRSSVPAEVDAAVRRHITKQREAVSMQNVAFMSIGTLVSMNRSDTQPTLMQWIDMLERQRLGRIAAAARAAAI